MSIDNNFDFFIFELKYKVIFHRLIKLFDYRFVNNNRDKCKIIYNGEEKIFTEYFLFDNNYNNDNSFKIILRIDNNITDLSYMFYNCKELLSIRDIELDNYNIADVNQSFSGFNSNNSSEKSNYSNLTDKSEKIYNDDLIQSTIKKIHILKKLI